MSLQKGRFIVYCRLARGQHNLSGHRHPHLVWPDIADHAQRTAVQCDPAVLFVVVDQTVRQPRVGQVGFFAPQGD